MKQWQQKKSKGKKRQNPNKDTKVKRQLSLRTVLTPDTVILTSTANACCCSKAVGVGAMLVICTSWGNCGGGRYVEGEG